LDRREWPLGHREFRVETPTRASHGAARMVVAARRAAVLALLLNAGCQNQAHTPEDATSKIHQKTPSFKTRMMGFFATGVAFADLNKDGFPDLVISNGNDMAPQPLVVHYSQQGKIAQWPDWYADEIDFHGNISIGDIDGDGWLDVAVAVPFDHTLNVAEGCIKVYFNRGDGRLETKARFRTEPMGGVMSPALGDANGDGRLDLAGAVYTLKEFSPTPSDAGAVFIHRNEGGVLQTKPSWRNAESQPIHAVDLQFSDIDQNGVLDLAVAADRSTVFFGVAPSGGEESSEIALPARASWQSEDTHRFSYGLDTGRVGDGPGLALAISSGCVAPGKLCPAGSSKFALYRPMPNSTSLPVWRSPPSKMSSKIVLVDRNADDMLDLVAGQWGDNPNTPGPLWIFTGQKGAFDSRPFATEATGVAQGIDVADRTRRCVRVAREDFPFVPRRKLVTLHPRRIERLIAVRVGVRTLSPSEYAWVVGGNWISLAKAPSNDETLSVEFEVSNAKDIAVANWDPSHPSVIYPSFAACVK
jgi:hypothetical protein